MKKIVTYLPAITVGAIILGCINVYANYIVYGIDILPYLEPTEVIFSFASISFELLAAFFQAILALAYGSLFSDGSKEYRYPKKRAGQSNWEKVVSIFYVLCGPIGAWVVTLTFDRVDFLTVSLLFSTMVLYPLYTVYYFIIVKNRSTYNLRGIIMTTVAFSLIVTNLFVSSWMKERYFTHHAPEYIFILTLTDSKDFKTNFDLRHIGNSNSYFFFKNVKSDEIIIIPTTEIKKIRRVKVIEPT